MEGAALSPDRFGNPNDWRLDFRGQQFSDPSKPITVRSVDLVLASPEERMFEFVVKSSSQPAGQ